jgi:hypothetical protein
MSNTTNLANLLLGGSITTPKSGAFIQNIHTVEYKYGGEYLIGGEEITYPYGILSPAVVRPRWTTIRLEED